MLVKSTPTMAVAVTLGFSSSDNVASASVAGAAASSSIIAKDVVDGVDAVNSIRKLSVTINNDECDPFLISGEDGNNAVKPPAAAPETAGDDHDLGILTTCEEGLSCEVDPSSSLGGRCIATTGDDDAAYTTDVAAYTVDLLYLIPELPEQQLPDPNEELTIPIPIRQSRRSLTKDPSSQSFCEETTYYCQKYGGTDPAANEYTSPPRDFCGFSNCCKDLMTFQELVTQCKPYEFGFNFRYMIWEGDCYPASLCGPPDNDPESCSWVDCCVEAETLEEEEECVAIVEADKVPCLTAEECDARREEISFEGLWVNDAFPSKGCFRKNKKVFFANGTYEEMTKQDLSGVQKRLWCSASSMAEAAAAYETGDTETETYNTTASFTTLTEDEDGSSDSGQDMTEEYNDENNEDENENDGLVEVVNEEEDTAEAISSTEGKKACLTVEECDKKRQELGFEEFYVDFGFPSKGCFSKNDKAYFGENGSESDMQMADLPGKQERIWCEDDSVGIKESELSNTPTDPDAARGVDANGAAASASAVASSRMVIGIATSVAFAMFIGYPIIIWS